MDDGRDDEDPRPFPPLPPEDRLWRHPSEVGAAAGAASPGAAPPAGRRRAHWITAALAAVVGAGVTLVVVGVTGGFGERVVSRDVVERVAVAPVATLPVGTAPGGEADVAAVASAAHPAIVRLEIDPEEGEARYGSGVVFRDNGYVLTSAAVVGTSGSIDVVLASGRTFSGERVGTDPLTDVAVVKIDGEGLPTAVLGTAESLAVGQPAISVGSPVALRGGPSLTVGVISGLGRTVAEGSEDDTRALHDMIQTDAPPAPGASGGALLDRRGAVVGITTSVGAATADAEGLGFATPIDVARAVANDIIIVGHARHPWLGIQGGDLDAGSAGEMGISGGAVVQAVDGGSPADVAGLDEDDVITSLAGVGVGSMADLVVELRRHEPGEAIFIEYRRDGREANCTALLTERPA
jgi:putative serine protease PepD